MPEHVKVYLCRISWPSWKQWASLLCDRTDTHAQLLAGEVPEPRVGNTSTYSRRIATIRGPLYALEQTLSRERGWMLQVQVPMDSRQPLGHPALRNEGTDNIQY